MNFVYPAIISKTDNGYHARFPDLEMCEADGPTLDACLDEARYAMEEGLGVKQARILCLPSGAGHREDLLLAAEI